MNIFIWYYKNNNIIMNLSTNNYWNIPCDANLLKKINVLLSWYKKILDSLLKYGNLLNRQKNDLEERNLVNNDEVIYEIRKTLDLTKNRIESIINLIENVWIDKINNEFYFKVYQIYRYYNTLVAAIVAWMDWQSISYESSRFPNISNTKELDYDWELAYKRVKFPSLTEKEDYFLDNCIEINWKENFCCLITSSWQGAYSTVENMIKNTLLKSNDRIAYVSQAYFETRFFTSMSDWNVEKISSIDAEYIASLIERKNIRFITLEPFYNYHKIDVLDIPMLIEILNKKKLNNDVYIIIDNSMLGWWFEPMSYNLTNSKINIFLIESLLKYRQLWLDMVNAWLIVAPKKYEWKLITSRAALGTIISDINLERLPLFKKDIFIDRMTQISNNAMYLANLLNDFLQEQDIPFNWVDYPWISTHRHNKIAKKYLFFWGVFTFLKKKWYVLSRTECHNIIKLIIQKANILWISINHWTSFWFETTRLALADTDGGTFKNTYLRCSVGLESKEEIENIYMCIKDSLIEYFKN